ncbi:nonsense-mediated mRNA decay protein 2-like [Pseudomyrmex gracilis]|uniref:nonsense-mediated mRNA decay protein 2-like n=1 Tax=Pseudomyrmex gracilis TaxID=219809 RepID=UPI00099572EA|nr:nonsense-mediated mRNA decay protein 2-like [Pseudomyrmex gracilis]
MVNNRNEVMANEEEAAPTSSCFGSCQQQQQQVASNDDDIDAGENDDEDAGENDDDNGDDNGDEDADDERDEDADNNEDSIAEVDYGGGTVNVAQKNSSKQDSTNNERSNSDVDDTVKRHNDSSAIPATSDSAADDERSKQIIIADLQDRQNKWHRHVHVRDLKRLRPDDQNNDKESDNETETDENEPRATSTIQNKSGHQKNNNSRAIKAAGKIVSAPFVTMSAEQAITERYSEMPDETLETLFESIIHLVDKQTASPEPKPAKNRRQVLKDLFGDSDLDEDLDGPKSTAPAKAIPETARKIRRLTAPDINARRAAPGTRIRATAWPYPARIQAPATTGTANIITAAPAEPPAPSGTKVEIQPGRFVDVPHKARHVWRKFKADLHDGRWILRFGGQGRLKTCRNTSFP